MQKKIRIRVRTTPSGSRIIARELDNNGGEIGGDGSIVAGKDDAIRWFHGGSGNQVFVVKFKEYGREDYDWPFSIPPRPNDLRLKVEPPGHKDTKLNPQSAIVNWKYEVTTEIDTGIEGLDPMIIIRSRSLAIQTAIAFGAGILIGALAIVLLT